MREVRGQIFKTPYAEKTLVVPHPASILRMQDTQLQQQEFTRWVEELKLIQTA
jgi:hypothetical protein